MAADQSISPSNGTESGAEELLSIIIPTYNEAARIGPTLARIRSYLKRAERPCEIIVVDDGSDDMTTSVVRGTDIEPVELRLLTTARNRGKGHAVRTGMLAAVGDPILMCDADLSTPIRELDKLQRCLDEGCDVAIASRDMPDSQLDPPQPFGRRWAGWAFRQLRARILLPGLRDTQCGFKLFRRSVVQAVFSQCELDGWLFDCEVLALSERLGYRICEVGVLWRNDPGTRVQPLPEAMRAIPTLLQVRRRVVRAEGRADSPAAGA